MQVKDRFSEYKRTALWGWWKVGVGIFSVLGVYDLLAGQVPTANLPSLEGIASWWDWRVWFIFALTLGLLGTMEGAYRRISGLKISVCELQILLDAKNKRKAIANRLAVFYTEGSRAKEALMSDEFDGNAIALHGEWSEPLIAYFRSNPSELGESRLLSLVPDNRDLILFGSTGSSNQEHDYVYRLWTLQLENIRKLVEEYLK